jgi:hypothetical protein
MSNITFNRLEYKHFILVHCMLKAYVRNYIFKCVCISMKVESYKNI